MRDLRGPIAGLVAVAVVIGIATQFLPSKKEADQSHVAPASSAAPSRWRMVEADNGTVYKIDTSTIEHFNTGSASIVFYVNEGAGFGPMSVRKYLFDCHGLYQDLINFSASTRAAPPRSVAGAIQRIACEGARDPRMEDMDRDNGAGETPDQYCADFTAEACERIKAVVATREVPSFCKPGFAVVGNPANKGLSDEQIRECYLMTSPAMPRLSVR